MSRWTRVAITALLVVIAAGCQPTPTPTSATRADGCPSTWHYANACSFIWINPERTIKP